MNRRLTKTEDAILRAIWADQDCAISYGDCRKAAGVTPHGFRRVFNRMEDDSLLSYQTSGDRNRVTITVAGMRALGVRPSDKDKVAA